MSIDPHAYTISVRRDIFDGEVLFEARVKELPDASDYGESFEEAYDLAIDTIETTAAAYAEQGRAFSPPQVPADDFSGRVTLRLPRSLHRALATAAEDEGVSLNAHLVNVLGYFAGFAAGARRPSAGPWQDVPGHSGPPARPAVSSSGSAPGGSYPEMPVTRWTASGR
jgi:predicted HicB family RNase H-like nuclease